MPTLTWHAGSSASGLNATAVVMSSKFRVRRFRDVPRFFIDSLRIYRQMRRSDGALQISLKARPHRREFYTLSAWRDRAALDNSVRAEPHRTSMRHHRHAMAEANFVFWDAPRTGLPITWNEAHRRLRTS
jgi:quinol monooxygenase YgiN